jgi:hypothetical protein
MQLLYITNVGQNHLTWTANKCYKIDELPEKERERESWPSVPMRKKQKHAREKLCIYIYIYIWANNRQGCLENIYYKINHPRHLIF